MNETKVCFIGCGNMARSMIDGLQTQEYQSLRVSSPRASKHGLTGTSLKCFSDNKLAAKDQEVIILAVKPAVINKVCVEIAPVVNQQQSLIISVAAGISLKQLSQYFATEQAIVRAMPNTAASIKRSATTLIANTNTSNTQLLIASDLLSAIGQTTWLENEALMNTATALAGSGPAYFFYLIEAMTAGACEQGMPFEQANKLAIETAVGAASLAAHSADSVNQLRRNVTSKGGTTEAALQQFDKFEMSAQIKQAIMKAYERANTLSKEEPS